MESLGFFVAVLKYKSIIRDVFIASFFVQIFALITPFFFQVIIDKVLVHQGLSTLHVLVIALVAVNFFDVILNGLRTYVFAHTTSRIDVELGAKLYKHLLGLPISYFQSRQTGQIVARVRELENVREFLTSNAVSLVLDVLFMSVFFVALFALNSKLAMIIAAFLPFYLLLTLTISPILKRRVEEQFTRSAANQSFLVESVSGAETIKSSATEPMMRNRWENNLAEYVKSSLRTIIISTFGSQGISLVSKLMTAAVIWFGAQAVLNGEMTLGMLIAFNMIVGHVTNPVLRLSQLWLDFQQFRISIDRLADVLNVPTESDSNVTSANLPNIKGSIEFDNVSFRYRPDGQQILSNVTLGIEAGQMIGMVGRSGSGKSTVTKLIQRLYSPETGRVLVDGVDLRLVDTSWLRRQIGVVLQDNFLMTGSIRENIALGKPGASMEEVMKAATIAGAHDFILELENGYDTQLYERGSNLSGGQRQRIAIARALITNPKILIFDEATSALDYESERIIQNNMKEISTGRTVIIIAHRLSTVRDADVIVSMEHGRIVEMGSHEELLQTAGVYSGLYRQQMREATH